MMSNKNIKKEICRTEQLRFFGISPSPQRTEIYSFLLENPIHPTADEIFKAIKGRIPTLSLTTVYNTLKILVEKHAVQEIIIEDGELRFDANMCDHAHFKCLACGKVYDLFPDPPGAKIPLPAVLTLPTGFRPLETHICLRGFCANPNCVKAHFSRS